MNFEQFDQTEESMKEERDPRPLYAFAKLESIPLDDEGRVLQFLRVSHTPETLETFGEAIESHVRDADVLISELAVFEDKEDAPDIEVFYKRVTDLAKQYQKEMIVADPERDMSDAIVNRSLSIAPTLAALGTSAYVGKKLHDISGELSMRKLRKKHNLEGGKKEPLMSRRDFLKGMGAVAVAAAGGLHGMAGLLEEMGISKEKGELLETFLLDSLDYRNALIAKEVIKQSQTHNKVSIIYGAAHIHGIEKFLNDHELLDKKIALYEKTYGLVNDSEPQHYNFGKEQ
jgi:hypothetical protein